WFWSGKPTSARICVLPGAAPMSSYTLDGGTASWMSSFVAGGSDLLLHAGWNVAAVTSTATLRAPRRNFAPRIRLLPSRRRADDSATAVCRAEIAGARPAIAIAEVPVAALHAGRAQVRARGRRPRCGDAVRERLRPSPRCAVRRRSDDARERVRE